MKFFVFIWGNHWDSILLRYITDALAREEELHQKRMHLKQLKESFARHRARFTSAKAKLVVLKSQWKHNQERNLLRAGTLEDAAGALQVCSRFSHIVRCFSLC